MRYYTKVLEHQVCHQNCRSFAKICVRKKCGYWLGTASELLISC